MPFLFFFMVFLTLVKKLQKKTIKFKHLKNAMNIEMELNLMLKLKSILDKLKVIRTMDGIELHPSIMCQVHL